MIVFHSEEIKPSHESPDKNLVISLLDEYEHHEKKVTEKKKELDKIYNHRPCAKSISKESPYGEFLLVYKYYQENLLNCLRVMNDSEENLKEVKNRLSFITPVKGKYYHTTESGETYVYGYLKFSANDRRFFLRKLSANEEIVKEELPTYRWIIYE